MTDLHQAVTAPATTPVATTPSVLPLGRHRHHAHFFHSASPRRSVGSGEWEFLKRSEGVERSRNHARSISITVKRDFDLNSHSSLNGEEVVAAINSDPSSAPPSSLALRLKNSQICEE